MPISSVNNFTLSVIFDSPVARIETDMHQIALHLPIPILNGASQLEILHLEDATLQTDPNGILLHNADQLAGVFILPADTCLESIAQQAYQQLLQHCQKSGFYLHRIWNYIPQINAEHEGLERYRQFNLGRWSAFEEHYGPSATPHMPAASAVGVHGSNLVIVYLAGKVKPQIWENPHQTPAYLYPESYGPKPPSFARALSIERRTTTYYLSGTASIEGHQTIGIGDPRQQWLVTMRNIHRIFNAMNIESVLSATPKDLQFTELRVYLRSANLLPIVQKWFATDYAWLACSISYQLADICRSDLDLEIEAIVQQRK